MASADKAAMKQRVFEQAEAAHVRFVSLQFTDIMGVVKNVHIPFHKFGDAVDHGLWFDGSSIEGFARIHESDMFLDPDLDTFGIIPWERSDAGATAKVICDVYTPDGESFAGDPRGGMPYSPHMSGRPSVGSSNSTNSPVPINLRR